MRVIILLLLILITFASPILAAPSLTAFTIQTDTKGNKNTLIPNVSKWVDAKVLAAGVAETITLPTLAEVVVFSATENFYANCSGGTAVVPVADVADGSASELNPSVRYIRGQGTISIVSPLTCIVTLSYYK